MRIQAANTFYTGTYSVLNTKSSFPYAVKVEGYGNTRNQRSLFQFAHVTITEHMVNAKYGTKITNGSRVQMQTAGSKKKEDWTEVSKEQLAEVKLPASFDKLKEQNSYFYHGENISDYELVQTAVALGKMELPTDEKKCIPDRVAMDAFEVLVRDQAAPKNSWSNTLYSEPRQAERCEDAPGQPERQPRTRHGPAPRRPSAGGHCPSTRMRAGIYRGTLISGCLSDSAKEQVPAAIIAAGTRKGYAAPHEAPSIHLDKCCAGRIRFLPEHCGSDRSLQAVLLPQAVPAS